MTNSPLPTPLVYKKRRANKSVLKNAGVRVCNAFTGGIAERFVRRSKNALEGKYRHKNLDWFLPAKGKESKGFSNRIDVEESSRSMVCYYKTYKKYRSAVFIYFFWHGRVRACRPGMHGLQVKN